MRRIILLATLTASLAFAAAASATTTHSNPCHTKHSCPSDHHTYAYGANKLYCTSYANEKLKTDTRVVTVGGRKYWCGTKKR